MREKLDVTLKTLKDFGADKAHCVLTREEKQEINVEAGKVTLMRTTFNTILSMTAIVNDAKGSVTINSLEDEDIRKACKDACEMAKVSQSDPANDIAEPEDGTTEFDHGLTEGDTAKLYDRMVEMIAQTEKEFPLININSIWSFVNGRKWVANSNGVKFVTRSGRYSGGIEITAKDGDKTSSMAGMGFLLDGLDTPFLDIAGVRELLSETVQHLDPKSINDKFVGDVVLAPGMAPEIAHYYLRTYLSDMPLFTGTSLLKGKLGEKVANELVTLYDNPEDTKLYFLSEDAYQAKNVSFIENGVLKSNSLSLYGSKKTGLERSKNHGSRATFKPGETDVTEVIAGVKRGILLCRFSGGSPSENGDITGVAKNSFYIEDGKIMFPIKETMIAANLLEMLKNVTAVSKETVTDSGITSPWVRISGVSITGM